VSGRSPAMALVPAGVTTPYVRIDEDISTDTMQTPAMLTRGPSFKQVNAQMKSAGGQRVLAALNAIAGIVLPAVAAYYYTKFGDRPCSKPVAGWLYYYALTSLITGTTGLWINFRQLSILPVVARANALPDGREKDEALATIAVAMGGIGCVSCCVLMPLGVFSFFWWIKGNFDVWGTYPRDDISPDEPFATFAGCDRDLLNGGRNIYLATYTLGGLTLLIFCAMMSQVLSVVSDEMEKQSAARAAGGVGVRRGPPMV